MVVLQHIIKCFNIHKNLKYISINNQVCKFINLSCHSNKLLSNQKVPIQDGALSDGLYFFPLNSHVFICNFYHSCDRESYILTVFGIYFQNKILVLTVNKKKCEKV